MFKRILVPVDDNPISMKAAQEAIELSSQLNAKIEFIHILDEQNIVFSEVFTTYPSIKEALRKVGEELLSKINEMARSASIDFESKLIELRAAEGRIPEKIIEEATNWSADLIMIGSHGRRGINKFLLGSIALNVIQSTSIPVLLIK